MLQVHVLNVSYIFRRMLLLNIFMLQVFYVVQPGASELGAWHPEGPADGGAMVGGRWGHAHP
jgi:hypothetical protein